MLPYDFLEYKGRSIALDKQPSPQPNDRTISFSDSQMTEQEVLSQLPFYKTRRRCVEHITTPTADGRSRFLELPPELQASITQWILKDHELARLCLVSKQLRDVVYPQLYSSLAINIDRWSHQHQQAFLHAGHRGHAFIRSLDVDSGNLHGKISMGKTLTCLRQDTL